MSRYTVIRESLDGLVTHAVSARTAEYLGHWPPVAGDNLRKAVTWTHDADNILDMARPVAVDVMTSIARAVPASDTLCIVRLDFAQAAVVQLEDDDTHPIDRLQDDVPDEKALVKAENQIAAGFLCGLVAMFSAFAWFVIAFDKPDGDAFDEPAPPCTCTCEVPHND